MTKEQQLPPDQWVGVPSPSAFTALLVDGYGDLVFHRRPLQPTAGSSSTMPQFEAGGVYEASTHHTSMYLPLDTPSGAFVGHTPAPLNNTDFDRNGLHNENYRFMCLF